MRTETVVARVVARLELAGAVAATDCNGNHGGTGTRAVSDVLPGLRGGCGRRERS